MPSNQLPVMLSLIIISPPCCLCCNLPAWHDNMMLTYECRDSLGVHLNAKYALITNLSLSNIEKAVMRVVCLHGVIPFGSQPQQATDEAS